MGDADLSLQLFPFPAQFLQLGAGTEQPPGRALPCPGHSPGVAPQVMLDLSILGTTPAPTFFPSSLIPITCPREKEQPKGRAAPSQQFILTGCTILVATIVLCPGFAEKILLWPQVGLGSPGRGPSEDLWPFLTVNKQ